jgi:nitrate/nitrite transporter NarK
MVRSVEQATMRKVYLRLLPFAVLTYFLLSRRDQRRLRRADDEQGSRPSPGDVRDGRRRLLLSLNYTGIVTASLGMLLFLPQIVKQLGITNMQVGWVTMIPYLCGAASMVFCGWPSDRIGDRCWSLFCTCTISTAGLVLAGMTIAAIGFYGTKGPF